MTPEILPPSPQTAESLRTNIDALVDQISGHEIRLARSYARLGGLLREVKNTQAWIDWGYERFSSFMEDIRKKIDRRRSQVYEILSVAEALLPYLSEDQLENIGIVKAHELKRLVKQGYSPKAYVFLSNQEQDYSDNVRIMDYAARPGVTAAQLRVKVNELMHVHEGPQGLWYDLGGCYFLPDEKKEWERAIQLGKQAAEVTAEKPEHEQLKEALLVIARESIGSLEAQVEQDSI